MTTVRWSATVMRFVHICVQNTGKTIVYTPKTWWNVLKLTVACISIRAICSLEPSLYYQSSKISQKRIKYVGIAWDILERYLADTPYVCGNELTIADFCLVATASSLTDFAPLDPVKHSRIAQWIERMAELPYYEETNGKGTKEWNDAVRALQKKYAGQWVDGRI